MPQAVGVCDSEDRVKVEDFQGHGEDGEDDQGERGHGVEGRGCAGVMRRVRVGEGDGARA